MLKMIGCTVLEVLIGAIPTCFINKSRNKFSQTQLILLPFKMTACFDSPQSSSGHYLKHMQVYQAAVYSLGIPKCITKIGGNNINIIYIYIMYTVA